MNAHISPTPTEVARELVQYILRLVDLQADETFTIALSGGNTPALLFDIWSTEFAEATPWSKLRFFWVDERCVPPTDAASNYGMTERHLLSRVPLREEQVFRIKGEDNPAEEAERYSSLVREEVRVVEGMPIFDLVLLGAGDDGHTSSIFPDRSDLLTSDQLFAVAAHPESGQQRIALTGQPIVHARNVVFLMTGAAKAPIYRDMLQNKVTGPATFVAHHALYDVEVFADEAVAQ
ncbi:MAG: 6-phosphogluconolactonase [Bacteroidaceae bacterium]|nr:6-phosphogluconolactonase [Bacteroidaceae bacterium]